MKPGGGYRVRVMVVDDDKEFLQEMKEILELHAFDARAFSLGACAVRMAPKIRPGVILLDLKLDDTSGFQVADALHHRADTAGIPIIAMTGHYAEREYGMLMSLCGIRTCLIKPLNPPDVIQNIRTVLGERR